MERDNPKQTQGASSDRRANTEQEDKTLVDRTHHAAESLKDSALEHVQAVRDGANNAKRQAAERVRDVSTALRRVGEHLRVEDQTMIAGYAASASQRIGGLASYIDEADVRSVLRDGHDIAKRKPAMFYGGAFILGLAAGRLLKIASPSSEEGAKTRSLQRTPRDPETFEDDDVREPAEGKRSARTKPRAASSSDAVTPRHPQNDPGKSRNGGGANP